MHEIMSDVELRSSIRIDMPTSPVKLVMGLIFFRIVRHKKFMSLIRFDPILEIFVNSESDDILYSSSIIWPHLSVGSWYVIRDRVVFLGGEAAAPEANEGP